MPEPADPALIAVSLADATSFTTPPGRTWCRLFVGQDTPGSFAVPSCPSVTVTPAAMAADPAAVHELVRDLTLGNPDLDVHLPPPDWRAATTSHGITTQADVDQTREELSRVTDELRARRLRRQVQAMASDMGDAWTGFLETVPSSRRTRAAREAIRRRIRTGMTQADALRSVAADYAAGRLS